MIMIRVAARSLSPRLGKTAVISSTVRSLNIAARPSDLVGNTPLLDLNVILKNHGVDGAFISFQCYNSAINLTEMKLKLVCIQSL